ncbi:MAG: Bacterial transcriptional activator domain [Candidatus Eremiobacteraeota bacterium]|nr:Bacterial transcriptional activator domain [Candidatus Eremiobacteraeota bacterium]
MIGQTERLAQLLHDAILIAETAREEAVLRHLRGARLSLHESTQADVPVRVDLLSGRVFACGLPVALSRTELAVVIALALNERGLPRELLAEDLHPGFDSTAAAKALKVTVHRARRRIGSADAIYYAGGRYALGKSVDVELPRLETELRHLRFEDTVTTEQRERLERLRQRVLDGRPSFVLEWPWFDETEQRLRELGRELALVLARDALRQERYERAIDLALELVREDPLDEVSAEFAIRAFLLAGNRTAAVLEYRRYASVLRREIDGRPGDGLRALVEEPGASDQPTQP